MNGVLIGSAKTGKIQEKWFAASGALGFDGLDSGHPYLVQAWKLPFRWLGKLDPQAFTIITKSVTLEAKKGRLKPWRFWYAAWPAHIAQRALANSVALTNPGIKGWIKKHLPRALKRGLRMILSIHADDPDEAHWISLRLHEVSQEIYGLQINAACPNVAHTEDLHSHTCAIVDKLAWLGLPILVKLGVGQIQEKLVRALEDREVAGLELINAMPYGAVSGKNLPPSPLAKYGYDGAISGGVLVDEARKALTQVRAWTKLPLISGGGMLGHWRYEKCLSGMDYVKWQPLLDEVLVRANRGADAISFGTAFLWNPASPNQCIGMLDSCAPLFPPGAQQAPPLPEQAIGSHEFHRMSSHF